MIVEKEKLRTPEYTALLFGFFGGFLIHLFGLVTLVHNSDDIRCQPVGYGTGVTSGRWLLTILGDFLKKQDLNYNLGLVNGLVYMGLLAVSAAIIVSIFRIRHRQLAALLGLVLVSFPTACSMLLYKYTAPLYGVAFLLSVFAVWVLPKYKIGGLLLSSLAIACSLGIYQAYLPVTASLFVLWLYWMTLCEEKDFGEIFRIGLYAVASLILGLLLYFLITQVSLKFYGKVLNDYQGIDKMGRIPLSQLPELVLNTYRRFFRLPFDNYCNLAQNNLLKIVYLLIYFLNFLLSVVIFRQNKKGFSSAVMALLLAIVFPVAVNLIEIMCPGSRIYTLMVYSCVTSALVPVVLLDRIRKPHKLLVRFVAGVLALFVMGNTYFNNLTYTSIYYVNRQTENYMTSLITQVRMTEGYSVDKRWAFIGTNSDPTIDNKWQSVPVYGGAEHTNRMVSAYSWKDWIYVYLGVSVPLAYNSTVEEIKQTQEFQEMTCWPNDGSIRIINDVIVIKFQEQ